MHFFSIYSRRQHQWSAKMSNNIVREHCHRYRFAMKRRFSTRWEERVQNFSKTVSQSTKSNSLLKTTLLEPLSIQLWGKLKSHTEEFKIWFSKQNFESFAAAVFKQQDSIFEHLFLNKIFPAIYALRHMYDQWILTIDNLNSLSTGNINVFQKTETGCIFVAKILFLDNK